MPDENIVDGKKKYRMSCKSLVLTALLDELSAFSGKFRINGDPSLM